MKAIIIAFSMYSRIPMPAFVWEERDRKKAMRYFPLVGVVVGILFYGMFLVFSCFPNGSACFRAAVLTAIPLLVTGGIHMDGFLDTCDALAAWGDREKRLKILKDSHIGAFAAIRGILYLLLYFGACTALSETGAAVTAIGFMLSRAGSGFLAAVLPGAREKGMLSDFIKDVDRRRLAAVMCGYLLAGFLAAAVICLCMTGPETSRITEVPVDSTFSALSGIGAAVFTCFERIRRVSPAAGVCRIAALLLSTVIAMLYGERVMMKQFGGITGDLAGYFLQVCELAMVLSQALLDCIFG